MWREMATAICEVARTFRGGDANIAAIAFQKKDPKTPENPYKKILTGF